MMKKLGKIIKIVRKLRVPKSLIHALIVTAVLLVLLVGTGVAYTYLGGPKGAKSNQAVSPAPAYTEPSFETAIPAPDTPVGVSTQLLTTPVTPGSNATFTIRTVQGAMCEIVVEYDEVESEDSGLIPKKADQYGMVSWTWTVEPTVPAGEWPIEVSCARNKQSGVLKADLEVKNQINEESTVNNQQ